jgi:phosphopantetheinyl transferase
MAFVQAISEEYWPCWQHHFPPEARLRLGGVVLSGLEQCTDLPALAGKHLHPDELGQWQGFSQEKRRVEWLGGRMAAKWAAAAVLGGPEPNWHDFVLRTEDAGRPYLATAPPGGAPCISISHSGGMAAALAANLPCGLDIQEVRTKIHTVRQRFASPEEEALLHAGLPQSLSESQRLTLLWSAKEAVRKMVRATPLLGFLEIRLLAIHGEHPTPQEPLLLTFAAEREHPPCPPPISVLCFFADNLAWAMACLPTKKE